MLNTSTMNAAKDLEISSPPEDSPTCVRFSPVSDWIAASSFDGKTRIWEVQPNGQSVPKAMITHDAPALGVDWMADGSKVISVGADKQGKMIDLATNQTQQVLSHDAPIKIVRVIPTPGPMHNIIVTGSWDKTVKYWDGRQPNPVHVLQMPERVYAMDVTYPLMVVGTADRQLMIYNLNNPSVPFKTMPSPLKWQTRVVSCFHNASGFAVGSIEGRVGIQYVEDKDSSKTFSFKCHRNDKDVYSVNAISFHPQYGTFSTAGSDGAFHFWDKDSKQRLKAFPATELPIMSTCFNRNGTIFAYTGSYDWSKGHEYAKQGSPHRIHLHAVRDEDIKPRVTKK